MGLLGLSAGTPQGAGWEQPPGVGDLGWGERRRALGVPRLGDRTSRRVALQNSSKACPEEGGKKGLWLGDAQPRRGCLPHG